MTCRVCGAPAHGYNFDQITCESCKAFFRRNALRDAVKLASREEIIISSCLFFFPLVADQMSFRRLLCHH